MSNAATISIGLRCSRCGYDLRAHQLDNLCPECGTSVAESRRLAEISDRPIWRKSDPKWRRRMLAGVWVLVLMPLVDELKAMGWASQIPVPNFIDVRHSILMLDNTLLFTMGFYPPILFCVGIALLCATEKGRRPTRIDWTRRWGLLCSYVTFIITAASLFFITALVSVGIGLLFFSMPAREQPGFAQLFNTASIACLRYGPQVGQIAWIVRIASSSIAVLLACLPLFDALRSSGSKRLALILIVPLITFSLLYLCELGLYGVGFSRVNEHDLSPYSVYFSPSLFVNGITAVDIGWYIQTPFGRTLYIEVAKWFIMLTIAIWLTLAQVGLVRKTELSKV